MVIKLLKKSEIDSLKAKDRQREINEGLKLAKTVDNLREVKAQEEESLTKFRNKMVSEINEEIQNKTNELNSLLKRIKDAEEEKAKAMIPLTEEWDKISEINKGLEKEKLDLEQRDLILSEKERTLSEREKDFEVKYTKLHKDIKKISVTKEETAKNFIESEKALEESRKIKLEISQLKEDVEQKLLVRENDLIAKEVDVSNKKSNLELKEKDLKNREKLLKDREQTLIRNIKRYDSDKSKSTSRRKQ